MYRCIVCVLLCMWGITVMISMFGHYIWYDGLGCNQLFGVTSVFYVNFLAFYEKIWDLKFWKIYIFVCFSVSSSSIELYLVPLEL